MGGLSICQPRRYGKVNLQRSRSTTSSLLVMLILRESSSEFAGVFGAVGLTGGAANDP
jgi:hypothetical protein